MHFHRYIIGLLLLFPFAMVSPGQTISCNSAPGDTEKHYCEADTRQGAHLVKQTSTVDCVEGKTWGWDEEGIWVNKGCGGQFALGKAEATIEAKPEHPPIPAKGTEQKEERMNCASNDGRRDTCDAELQGATVKLVRQIGPAPCTKDSTWGYDDRGIWVDRGCRGEFVIMKQGGAGDVSCEKAIGKKESKKLVSECLQVSPATHPPCNAANSCVLIKEEIRRSCGLIGKDAPKFCEEYK